jgi:hypothetical protein
VRSTNPLLPRQFPKIRLRGCFCLSDAVEKEGSTFPFGRFKTQSENSA